MSKAQFVFFVNINHCFGVINFSQSNKRCCYDVFWYDRSVRNCLIIVEHKSWNCSECSVLLSFPPWWPPPWQPSSPPPPLSSSKSARLRRSRPSCSSSSYFTIMTKITMVTVNTKYSRPPAATSQFLMRELLLTKPIAQPPARWPGKHWNPFELSSFVNQQ